MDLTPEETDLVHKIAMDCILYVEKYGQNDKSLDTVINSLESVLASYLYDYSKGDIKRLKSLLKDINKIYINIFNTSKRDFSL